MPHRLLRLAQRVCWSCVATGVFLCAAATAAIAADAAQSAERWLLVLAVSLIGTLTAALVGFYTRTVDRRVSSAERAIQARQAAHAELRELVLTRSHDKTEIDRLLTPLSERVDTLLTQQGEMRASLAAISAHMGIRGAPPNYPRAHTGD